MMLRRKFLRIAAGGAAISVIARAANAQNYPARPLRLILGYPAGGSTDLVARIMGAWLTERLGQSVVIENKPGAGTNLAAQAAVTSPPDGYTLLFVTTTNAINTSFHASLPFDFLRDLAPVAALVELPFIMEVTPSLPAKTIAEFIAHAKANPAVQAHGRRRLGARAVPWRRADGDRLDRRPRAGGNRRLAKLAAAHSLRRAARARHHRA